MFRREILAGWELPDSGLRVTWFGAMTVLLAGSVPLSLVIARDAARPYVVSVVTILPLLTMMIASRQTSGEGLRSASTI